MTDEQITHLAKIIVILESLEIGEMVNFNPALTEDDVYLLGRMNPTTSKAWRMTSEKVRVSWWRDELKTVAAARYL